MTLFPNPAHEYVVVEVNSVYEESASLKICNILGEVLLERSIVLEPGLNTVQIPLSEICSGMYFLSMTKNNASSVIKLLIQ